MYMVFKGNVPQGNRKFETYEKARSAARAWCRKKPEWQEASAKKQPSLREFGYRIIAVNS